MSVTFYTDVWGTYFRQILSPGWLLEIARNCGCLFKSIRIVRNNIPDDLIEEYCDLLGARMDDTLDSALHADNCAPRALKHFYLEAKDFAPLLYQSLADLVAIYHCSTEYIVFFSGDALPWGRSHWVRDGVKLLEAKPEVMIVNPVWNGFYEHAKAESFAEDDQAYYSRGFSDQCYLARTAELRADIYHETHPDADAAFCPAHGNTFEKRVNAYMRNHGRVRASLKSAAYITRP